MAGDGGLAEEMGVWSEACRAPTSVSGCSQSEPMTHENSCCG